MMRDMAHISRRDFLKLAALAPAASAHVQSALVAAMQNVTDDEARKIRAWLDKSGITFLTGPNEETDLTDAQVDEALR